MSPNTYPGQIKRYHVMKNTFYQYSFMKKKTDVKQAQFSKTVPSVNRIVNTLPKKIISYKTTCIRRLNQCNSTFFSRSKIQKDDSVTSGVETYLQCVIHVYKYTLTSLFDRSSPGVHRYFLGINFLLFYLDKFDHNYVQGRHNIVFFP